jgi:Tfp pilus assembly protein PilW
LLITAAIFVLILVAIGGLLVSSSRAYSVTTTRTEAIQDSEAVLQLMRYEVALAGYRGIALATYERPFTSGVNESIVVNRAGVGDELTVRYIEDRYISGSDTGERVVTFRVDTATDTLVRVEGRPSAGGTAYTTELLVGNIARMDVLAIIDRFRTE